MNYAVHPGSLIKMLLMSSGKKQKWLSEEMGVSKVVISELIHGKRSITPQLALAFEKAMKYPAENLVRLQGEYDLFLERQESTDILKKNFVSKWTINEEDRERVKLVETTDCSNIHQKALAV